MDHLIKVESNLNTVISRMKEMDKIITVQSKVLVFFN